MDVNVTDISTSTAAQNWLRDFAAALDSHATAPASPPSLPHECHWRDILAFTWDLHTTSGASAIAERLGCPTLAANGAARHCSSPPGRTPPRARKRAGTEAIEAIFTFETVVGPCNGVVRLVSDGGTPRAWTLMTALDEIRGHEDPANGRRWQDVDWKRNFGGENWADRRRQAAAYDDRDPAVLVVGAAQAGLMIAARLSMLGIDTLAIEPQAAPGRFVAQPLPRAHAAQRDAGQPLPLHAVPALLAGVHSQGHAGELVRTLCRGDGAQRLDRHRTHVSLL